jgi:methyl-accepting chemotaxis protein/cytochrome b561
MAYPRPLQLVHWTVAILVACQLAIAVVLGQLRSLEYGQLVLSVHRHVGILILLLVATRFWFARRYTLPGPVTAGLPAWQVVSAALVHRALLATLIAQPLIGILLAWSRGDAVGLFGIVELAAPFEFGETTPDRLTTVHAAVAIAMLALTVVHIGAVIFNHTVRKITVIDRMSAVQAADRLVNRVPIGIQLACAFGLVISIAVATGTTAVSTYRSLERLTTEFQATDVAATEHTRAALMAWRELTGLTLSAKPDAARIAELLETTRSSLAEAAAAARVPEIRDELTRIAAGASAEGSAGIPSATFISETDTRLEESVDAQVLAAFQRRTENDQQAARGHDVIVLMLLPTLLAGLIASMLLARSVTGLLSRMRLLIHSIESDQRGSSVQAIGEGEFASLTRAIISMRVAVEQRSHAAAAERERLESERTRMVEEQQQREVANERQQRVERAAQRESLAAEFELQIGAIVDMVARTAQEVKQTAQSMAQSAADTTQSSRSACTGAEHTNSTAASIATGTAQLSTTAQSVRQNAEQSRKRAQLTVSEATAAAEQIDHLVEAARQISSITDLIAGVARQSNLLAINARVEAARVGELGRGFSIVANEVKDLSEKTRNATIDIGAQIEQVNTAVARSSQSLRRLRDVIGGLEGEVAAIFESTDGQFAATRDIASRASEISSATRAVAQEMREAESAASTTEQMSAAMMEAADSMDQGAAELREQVMRFLLQLRNSNAVSANVGAADRPRTPMSQREPASAAASPDA